MRRAQKYARVVLRYSARIGGFVLTRRYAGEGRTVLTLTYWRGSR